MKLISSVKPLAIAAIAIVSMTTMGAGVIYAAQNPTAQNRMSGLVTAIATRFHLNQADVQQVFDEQRLQVTQQMQLTQGQHEKTKLDQAVKAGKLTQAQEDLIIAKQAEMKTLMNSLKGKTPGERQTALKAQTDTLKAWAQTNNIPMQYLMPFGGGMRGGRGPGRMGGFEEGRGRGMGHFSKPSTSPIPSPNN